MSRFGRFNNGETYDHRFLQDDKGVDVFEKMKLPLLVMAGTVGLLILVSMLLSNHMNAPVPTELVLGDIRNATGSAQAVVTVVEFSDFQCPACKAIEPLVFALREAYPNEVRLVYRHFPLTTIHPNAHAAAVASEVAADFGKFWEFHAMLYDKQGEWSPLSATEVRKQFIQYAEQVGIKKDAYVKKLSESDTYEKRISLDINDVTVLGINATPTFFVNGEKVQIQYLKEAVEKYLKK